MSVLTSITGIVLALALSPLMRSVINRTKALFAGRQGPPLLLPYYQLARLFGKGAVYSRTTTWIFRAGPPAGLATVLAALLIVPSGWGNGPVNFQGDLILFAYLLGLGRFFTILAALDTGSSFEGMGASREAFFSALAEPAMLLGLGRLAAVTGSTSLSGMYAGLGNAARDGSLVPALVFIVVALLIIYLAENSRIPVDDPTTHLELTMIHEVMVLDHGGPDLGFIEYAGALRLWVLGLLITGILIPFRTGSPLLDGALSLAGLFAVAVTVGVIESTMARLKMKRVPLLLSVAFALSALWVIWVVR